MVDLDLGKGWKRVGVEKRVFRGSGFAWLESRENSCGSSFGLNARHFCARASKEVIYLLTWGYSMEPVNESSDECQLKTRVANLLDSEVMSDVMFLVDQPPKRCPCHKLILGLGSQVFKAMFYGEIKEKDEIHVPDVTKEGFSIMLRYLYSGEIKIESEYDAFEAAYVSKKYLIRPLFQACEKFLLSNVILDPETVFSLYEEASFLEMKRLQSHCLSYVSKNAKRLFHTKFFNTASKSTIEDILKLDLMDIESEIEIIEALWHWGEKQCKELNLECTDKNIRFLTKDFLQYVRFLSMKMEDLKPILEKFQLLDTSEELAILWNLTMPKSTGFTSIPSNLCEIARNRSVNNCSRIELPTEYKYDGNLMTFHTDECYTTAEVVVTGSPLFIVGAVLAFRTIPCYSATHRMLDFEMTVGNTTTNLQSSVKSLQKAEAEEQLEQELFLDEYVAISEGETAQLAVRVATEGVRIMQCKDKEFSLQCGKACVTFRFDTNGADKLLIPIKEIMCVAG
ncbi:hypothetical protein NPIL_37341 [Nephila pilipes]|uniref:BTB domain-containing protein n=1 Tax=Nephila pilipes TaxID=299642 RepID=A0A8X6Q2J2_NEPPI|nr:hypothetical protein NPIL_37341 [Nephila pilipes]